MSALEIFAPILVFFAFLVWLSLRSRDKPETGFLSEYFLGGRSLRGFVLAMSLVATYGSVSSFVSGPGLAWRFGLGWVAFAAPQIITGFLVLGVLGSKLALIGRRLGAVTVIDVLAARFQSRALAIYLAALLLIFFTAMMVGQFIGGAQIISQAAGIGYVPGLLIFGLIVVFYTSFGGFRAVALTDAACAVLMVAGMFFLGSSIVQEAGGWDRLIEQIHAADEQHDIGLFSPTSNGALPWSLLFSAWILVGFATAALPQSAVRCLAYKKSEDLKRAMLVATVVCGALMIGMTMMGFLARAVLPEEAAFGGNTDAMIPYLIAHHMSPWMAGLTLIGPLAATMSTVSSLLIAASSAIVKDIFIRLAPEKGRDGLLRRAQGCTFGMGVLALILAIFPLDLIAWINLFAFGGLEIAFLCPLIGGLFWARATAKAAFASVTAGLLFYLGAGLCHWPLGGWHAVVPSLAISAVVFVIVALLTAPAEPSAVFFPDKARKSPSRRDGGLGG